jgi:hypothetical protein
LLRKLALALLCVVAVDSTVYALWPRFSSHPFAAKSIPELRESMRTTTFRWLTDPNALPPVKTDGEFVIGVFGGSVASLLASTWSRDWRSIPGSVEISRRVGKPLRIENLAQHSGAEPAQYNLLHLFHDRIDAAVFVDGFNELFLPSVVVGGLSGCERLRPFWQTNHASAAELLRPNAERRQRLQRFADSWVWVPLRYSGIFKAYLLGQSVDAMLGLRDYLRTMTLEDLPRVNRSETEIASEWATCIALSDEYAAIQRLPIVFFLQPNQYVRASKPFSDEEKARCFGRFEGQRITERYALMEEQLDRLRARGVAAYSLVGVFRDRPETLYIDDCCHVNDRANRIMADAIAARILERLPAP